MSIVIPSDFKGENTIAQVPANVGGVSTTVQDFINKYEKKFLLELLGATLYAEFIAGLALPDIDPLKAKWVALRDETDLKPMIIDYVYYYYMLNQATSTAGIGEVKGKTDNATPVNNMAKMVRSWNEMVGMARLFDLSTTDYPDWNRVYWRHWWFGCGWHISEIYQFKNTLDF